MWTLCGVRPYTEGFAMLRPHLEYVQVKDAVLATGTVVTVDDAIRALAVVEAVYESARTGESVPVECI